MIKRTVLSDSLEKELTERSPNPVWRFEVRETTCSEEDCNCELIAVAWFGHPVACSDHLSEPLVKSWYTEELRRRRSMGDFAQAILTQLVGADDHE